MSIQSIMRLRNTVFALTLAVSALLLWGCKKTPTSATTPNPTGISASFNPTTATADTVVSFIITVSANSKEIRAFGAEVGFDSAMFSFQGVVKGSLTGNWALVDGNEGSPGTVTVGGSVGDASSVPANSTGTLLELRFKVTGGSLSNGQQNRVCLKNFADDLTQFTSGEACAVFTLKK